tara:strand:+ start:636 stop:1733 length:1098 start_codon:yes stop_codon:yes gene_type:complete
MMSQEANNIKKRYRIYELILYSVIMLVVFLLGTIDVQGQTFKKTLKFATFYTAFSGGNSIADDNIYSITNGLQTDILKTPFDYSFTAGVRKIARFGYENRANVFYDGTEKSYSDAATIGKVKGFEFLFEADWRRQQGRNFLDQDYFLRYVAKNWIAKAEYLQDGFADVQYFEGSQRLRLNANDQLSFNIGVAQRISEPYGYNPLEEWVLSNNNIHYTSLAIQEGYTVNVQSGEYFSPEGELVANSVDVWEQVVIPEVINDYVAKKRNELPNVWNYSMVVGYDYYKYSKEFWMHNWVSVMPYHLKTDDEFSYFETTEGGQWLDYGAGLIFGWRLNKSLGVFLEGKYNKYWNREWHDFSVGLNYVIL